MFVADQQVYADCSSFFVPVPKVHEIVQIVEKFAAAINFRSEYAFGTCPSFRSFIKGSWKPRRGPVE